MSPQVPNPWQVQSAQLRFENPWIRIVQNDVIHPSGKVGEYTVVHFKNRAVAVIPIDDENHTWLIGQYRFAVDSYEWEIPAGGAPTGETILDCAKRELAEETGLIADRWDLIMEGLQLSNSVTDELAYTFVARGLRQGPSSPDESEQLSVRRVPLEEAVEMALRGEIRDAFSVVSLLKLEQLKQSGFV